MLPIYYDFFKSCSDKNEIILQGSRRSGKTYSIIQYLSMYGFSQKKRKILLTNPTYPQLQNLIQDFENVTTVKVKGKKTLGESAKIGNATFVFKCFDDPTKAQGVQADIVVYNECNLLEKKFVDTCNLGIREKKIYDFNPANKFWIDKKIKGDNFLRTTWRDNPYLTDTQKNNFLEAESAAKEPKASVYEKWFADVYCYGKYGDIRGNIFSNVDLIDNYDEITAYHRKIYGLDFGYSNDPCALVELVIIGNTVYIRELLYKNKFNDFDLADVVNAKCNPDFPIICDFGNGGDARMANLALLVGNRTLQKAFKPAGSVTSGVALMSSYKYKIEGENTYNNFLGYSYQEGEGEGKPVKKNDHSVDATRYAFDCAIRSHYFSS